MWKVAAMVVKKKKIGELDQIGVFGPVQESVWSNIGSSFPLLVEQICIEPDQFIIN